MQIKDNKKFIFINNDFMTIGLLDIIQDLKNYVERQQADQLEKLVKDIKANEEQQNAIYNALYPTDEDTIKPLKNIYSLTLEKTKDGYILTRDYKREKQLEKKGK